MQFKNVKKALLSSLATLVTLSAVTACAGNNDQTLIQPAIAPAQDISTFSTSNGLNVKFGMNMDSPKIKSARTDFKVTNGSTKKADNRQYCAPIANQGQLGSCTAFAAVKGLREYLMIRDAKPLVELSALGFYYDERKADGDISEDGGSTMQTSMDILTTIGAGDEKIWPYDTSKFDQEPPKELYTSAANYVVKDDIKLTGLDDIKAQLDKKNPVIFGVRVYESFMKSVGGAIPTPDTKHERLLGGHALSFFGYDDAKGVLIGRNSWGTTWGDKGYFYLPYSYFKLGLISDIHAASATVLRIGK